MMLSFTPLFLFTQNNKQGVAPISLRIVKESNNQITPTILCVTALNNNIPRIPPNAEISKAFELTNSIYYSKQMQEIFISAYEKILATSKNLLENRLV